jgi:hypothetical protein
MSELYFPAQSLTIEADCCLQLLDSALKHNAPAYGPESFPPSHNAFVQFAKIAQDYLDACSASGIPADIPLRQALMDPIKARTILEFSQRVINDLAAIESNR